jgi:poly(3-hydroxybutyrate) depolymerase
MLAFIFLSNYKKVKLLFFLFGLFCFFIQKLGSEESKPVRLDSKEETTERDYAVYVPESYNTSQKWPLIISVHPAGGNGSKEIRKWIRRADEKNFIVLCPTCIVAKRRMKSKEDFFAIIKEDEKAISYMIELITKEYSIDSNKILLTGFSGGGFLVWYYGIKHPEIITAIASRSGNFTAFPERKDYIHGYFGPTLNISGLKNLSVYVVYGEKDHPIAIKAAEGIKDFLSEYEFMEEKIECVPGMNHSDKYIDHIIDWFFSLYSE